MSEQRNITHETITMSPEEERETLSYISGRLSSVSELLAMSAEDREKFDQDARDKARQQYYSAEGQGRLGNNDPSKTLEPSEDDINFIARTVEDEIRTLKAELAHLQTLMGYKNI